MKNLENLKNTFRSWFPSGASYCFYCQVDSEQIKGFLIIVIGGLFLASLFGFMALWLKGKFDNMEEIKEQIFEWEERK